MPKLTSLIGRPILLAFALLALGGRRAVAQIGSSTDIITGTVTRATDGSPIQDATVEAYSLETQVTRRSRTDARGRYTILFPDGGGQYRMTARIIGTTPRTELLQRNADEDRLVWNVRLSEGAVTLEQINVRTGGQPLRAPDGPTPGSVEQGFNAQQVARLPADIADLNSLASLVPGVLSIGATDSTPTSFSVAGLGADANALTLDGLLFGNASIPQEGLRQTRVVTSTYDVSRGQFSGGLIASTTRSGSNIVQGSTRYELRDENLAVTEEEDSPYASGYTQHVLSGGVGGPIVKDRMFVFGSAQARLRYDPQQSLLTATSADLVRLGVHPDSVARFMHILDSLGVQPSPGISDQRSNDNLSALLRLDYVLSNEHTITLRGDWRGTGQDPTRLGALALPQTGGTLSTGGAGVMATLTSRFGSGKINEGRFYYSGSFNNGDPFTQVPAGRVQVASDLPDGTLGITTLAFGGNSGLPTTSNSHLMDWSDELSWLPGSASHRLKLGLNFTNERSRAVTATNTLGSFSYNSLGELENGQAAQFRRTVGAFPRVSNDYRWGIYAGDVWVIKRPFQLTYGARLEGSAFANAPRYNGKVDSTFGYRTDELPKEWHLSPRAGFTWTLGGGGGFGGGGGGRGGEGRGGAGGGGGAPFQGRFGLPTLVIRGGVGEFRSQPPSNLVAQARSSTGLLLSSGDVNCNGFGVPVPDWGAYWTDQSAIPDQCTGSPPPGTPGFQVPRSVLVLDPGFDASRAWRGSLGLEKRLTQIFRFTVDWSFARGVAQTGYRDLNLDATPQFTLAEEGNRPVYVAPSQITPTTGQPFFAGSRVDTSFGQVIRASSDLHSTSQQVTLGLSGVIGRAIQLNLSYTWQHARSELTGLRGGNTAADPNVAEWATSDFQRTHSMLATITYPLSQSLEITSIARATSGTPFTPTVAGDVNGDGARDDRAFIFAPGTGTAEAAGMQRLLQSASSGIRGCLEAQIGAVALRNSCTGPWQYTLDFQLNYRPTFFGLNRRMTMSLVTVNFLRGLDELVHGADNAHGWGLATRPDNTLLYVSGFDSTSQRFNYNVNERFGATYGSATAYRPPFQIGIAINMVIGPDRQRQALDALRAGGAAGLAQMAQQGGFAGQGGFRPQAINPSEMLTRLEQALPNPAGTAIAMKDSLHLDSAQIVLLTPLRDSLAAHNTARIDSLRRVVDREGNNPNNLLRLMPALRPVFQQAREEIAASLVSVRAILRDEQFVLLPDAVKNAGQPGRGFGVPGQQGPGRPGEGRPRP